MKKLALVILTLIACLCVFGVAACDSPDTLDEHTHSYSTDWSYDNSNHWHKCDCGEKGDEAMHTPGTEATQTTPQTCTVCGYVVKEALGEDPTPETPEHTHEYIYLTKNDNYHWYECECGENNGKTEHGGGTATCLKKAVCKICGQEYGDLVEHSHDYVVYDSVNHWYECECGDKKDIKEHIPGAPATETTHQTCTECGYVITPAIGHVHSYSKVKYDKVNHWNECDCGDKEDTVKHTITSQPKDGDGDKHVCEEREYLNKCNDCGYSYDSTITLGHKYVKIAESGYYENCQSFNVLLECEEPGCSATAKATATLMAEKTADAEHGTVATTCKVAGHDEYSYEYEYTNGEAPETKTAYIKKNEAAAPSAEHTFVSKSGLKFASLLDERHEFGAENGPALKALIDDVRIRSIAGLDIICSNYTNVVADCDVCGHPITFEISGEHNFYKDGELDVTAATCVVDEYLSCQDCSYTEKTANLAEGHVWEYKAHTFDKVDMTVTLECDECKATKSAVAVTFVEEKIAKTCAEDTISVYKTIDKFTNGLATTHDNFKEDFVICDVVRYDEIKYHTITAQGVTIENLVLSTDKVNGAPVIVSWNENIAKLVREDADGKQIGEIRWIAGIPDCANYSTAIFDCSVCNQPITINLTGAHKEVGDMKTKEATCIKCGYEYKECTVANCLTNGEVVYKYNDATEHNFGADAASEAAFMVKPTIGGRVTFRCYCNTTVDLVCTNILARVPGDGVCTPDKTPYVFEYAYNVTNYDEAAKKEVVENVKVSATLYDTVGPDSHKLVVGTKTIDGIDNNQKIEKTDANISVWWSTFDGEEPLLRWIAGKPADCLTASVAVFDCADCHRPVLVELYGKCEVYGGECIMCGEHYS